MRSGVIFLLKIAPKRPKKAPFWEPLSIFGSNSPFFLFFKLFFNYCVHVTHNITTLGLFFPIWAHLITEKSQKHVEKNPISHFLHFFTMDLILWVRSWLDNTDVTQVSVIGLFECQDARYFIGKLPQKGLKNPHFWNHFRYLAIRHQCFVVLGLFVI